MPLLGEMVDPGLGQKEDKVDLGHLAVQEDKEMLEKGWGHTGQPPAKSETM
jgi:hypothetical protein